MTTFPQLKIATAPGRAGTIANWHELDRWARINEALWHAASAAAVQHGFRTETERLQLIAWVLLGAYRDQLATRPGVEEMNPGNEALTQLRGQWEKILLAVMRKHGIAEVTLDAPELEQLLPPDNPPVLVVLGRKQVGPHGGFTLKVAANQQEALELVALNQGRG